MEKMTIVLTLMSVSEMAAAFQAIAAAGLFGRIVTSPEALAASMPTEPVSVPMPRSPQTDGSGKYGVASGKMGPVWEAGHPDNSRKSRRGGPRAMKAYVPARATMTLTRLKSMDLTPHERMVAEYIIRAGKPVTRDDVAKATGIGRKSVESPLYQLRVTTPAVIKSEPLR